MEGTCLVAKDDGAAGRVVRVREQGQRLLVAREGLLPAAENSDILKRNTFWREKVFSSQARGLISATLKCRIDRFD